MRRLTGILLAASLLALLATPARADFGLKNMSVSFLNCEGDPSMQAGSHPCEFQLHFESNTKGAKGEEFIEGAVKDLDIVMPEGFTGNATAIPRCATEDFLQKTCPDSAALGFANLLVGFGRGEGEEVGPVAIYNLLPSPGTVAKVGFWVANVPVTTSIGLSQSVPHRVVTFSHNTSSILEFFGADVIVWGNPAHPAHDTLRGHCLDTIQLDACPANIPVRPFMTLPRSCKGELITIFEASAWWTGDPANPDPPGPPFKESAVTPETTGCSKLGLAPDISAQPSTENAESPSGLDFTLEIEDEGLNNPDGYANQSDIEKAVVTLPQGMTINPAQAEGLKACSKEQLDEETLASGFGEGCPGASKVGTVEAESPAVEGKVLNGSLFVAQPYQNPTGSLIALYMVIKEPELGVILKLPVKVTPDPKTGQLISTVEDVPQQPISRFHVHLREGAHSPLVTPPTCGTYTTLAEFTPSANPGNPVSVPSSFQITRGVGGAPCPPAGRPPFAPGLQAGSLSNDAGSHSPFYLRLTRRDGDQDLTRFDATLPPGMVAKLAGVTQCPEAQIALAKAKTGTEELASPSCPASSQIGRALSGAGVGSGLLYVPGKVYLAGPFGGAPLSVIGVVPAVAGPFDVGTVVVRQALQINPRTAEVRADGALSDPIPHILAGIPLKVRDIRVYVDRPEFTLNPTSCNPFATLAEIWGGGLDVFSKADDAPVSQSAHFQAANCANLGFKPGLSIKLKGGNKRGGHPAARGELRPRPTDANISSMVVRLPRSAFLDQGHIRTICTRVQFAAKACPKGAIYGHARVFSPLIDDPLEGPIYLRSSSNKLPDVVFALHGLIDVEAVARVDSIKGGIRLTFEGIPDAPISKAIASFQGGEKGLIVNSRDLCVGRSRATLQMDAHNAKRSNQRPLVRPSGCGGGR